MFMKTPYKQDIHNFRVQSNYFFANRHNRLIGLMSLHADHWYAYHSQEDTWWAFDRQANMCGARKPSASAASWNRLIFGIDELLFPGSMVFISFGFSLKGFCIFSCHTFIAESLSCWISLLQQLCLCFFVFLYLHVSNLCPLSQLIF